MEIRKLHCATGLDHYGGERPSRHKTTWPTRPFGTRAEKREVFPPLTGMASPMDSGQSVVRGQARCCPGGSRGGEEPDPGCWRDKHSIAEVGDDKEVGGGMDDGDSPDKRSPAVKKWPRRDEVLLWFFLWSLQGQSMPGDDGQW
jgi:hypothetical protein